MLKTLRCHKVINDFLFIDSSSLLLTIGTSNDSYVISLWDTLMPSNKSLIKSKFIHIHLTRNEFSIFSH